MAMEGRTLNVRYMSDETLEQMKSAAGARGMSLREYLTALVDLHRQLRAGAKAETVLRELNLAEVRS